MNIGHIPLDLLIKELATEAKRYREKGNDMVDRPNDRIIGQMYQASSLTLTALVRALERVSKEEGEHHRKRQMEQLES